MHTDQDTAIMQARGFEFSYGTIVCKPFWFCFG